MQISDHFYRRAKTQQEAYEWIGESSSKSVRDTLGQLVIISIWIAALGDVPLGVRLDTDLLAARVV